MADEAQTLKRDSTMVATATEGNAILEKLGKVDEDAKTRSQQKKIEDEAENESEATPKMERTTTMAATAKVRLMEILVFVGNSVVNDWT